MAINTILIPTDFSDLSNKAIKIALPMVKQLEGSVVFVHVLDLYIHPEDLTTLLDEGLTYFTDRSITLLNDLVNRTKEEGIDASYELEKGTPYDKIIRMAKKIRADLIMMGTHGRTGFDHMFMGSQAERVVRMASCPVTTIKVLKSDR